MRWPKISLGRCASTSNDLWAAQAFVTALGPARLDSIEIPIGLA